MVCSLRPTSGTLLDAFGRDRWTNRRDAVRSSRNRLHRLFNCCQYPEFENDYTLTSLSNTVEIEEQRVFCFLFFHCLGTKYVRHDFFGARQTQKARGETKDASTTLTPRSLLLATSSVIEKSDEIPHDSERSDGSPVARSNLVRTSGRIRDGRPVTATARSNPLYLSVICTLIRFGQFIRISFTLRASAPVDFEQS